MGANSSIPVQITEDGKIPIPEELREQLRLAPFQTVYLAREGDKLLVTTMSRQDIGERIVHLLEEGLSGVAWEEIERGRAFSRRGFDFTGLQDQGRSSLLIGQHHVA